MSWLIPSYHDSEHPSYALAPGAAGVLRTLDILTSNRALWERTALVVSYDENGGFFDHVSPPTPAPIGLGFRVPCLVISPYSRGGRVHSEVLDHTSQLRLIGARFGVPVPNLTAWRQGRRRYDRSFSAPSPHRGFAEQRCRTRGGARSRSWRRRCDRASGGGPRAAPARPDELDAEAGAHPRPPADRVSQRRAPRSALATVAPVSQDVLIPPFAPYVVYVGRGGSVSRLDPA